MQIISKHFVLSINEDEEDTANKKEIYNNIEVYNKKNGRSILEKYSNVFSEINEELKIAAEIPGKTKQEKMRNTALLYCYGSRLRGMEWASSKEIHKICEEHGFLYETNFSKIFSKTLFLTDRIKGEDKRIKLTFKGEKTQRN